MKKSKETLVLVGGPRTGKTASLVAKAAKEDAYIICESDKVAGFSAMTITIKDKTCNKLKYLTFIFAKNDDCVSMIPMEFDLDDLEN